MRNNLTGRMAAIAAAALILASCGTSRQAGGGKLSDTAQKAESGSAETVRMDFLRKVYDNEVYSQCITSKIKFTVNNGSKDLTVAGSLKMKRDDVIRIQLTPFGLMEAARIEFTKDYVLIIDRINKRYLKEDYTKVDFLNRNGLDFYALQALFWNQLYMPGETRVSDSALKKYTVAFNDDSKGTVISYAKGGMSYDWTTENKSGRITAVSVAYGSKANGRTQLDCSYGAFKALQTKMFPTDMTMTMKSDAVKKGRTVTVKLGLTDPGTDSDWETRTEVSSKYTKVTAQELLQMLSKGM